MLIVGAAAVLPAQTTQDVLATAAATLFEGTPFILAAGLLAARLPVRFRWAIPLFGCGCGDGPAARSIPALIATWLSFGPMVALLRFGAAALVAAILARGRGRCTHHAASVDTAGTIAGLLPYGLLAGAIAHVAPLLVARAGSGPAGALTGAMLGFVLAPCGIGVVGIGGALRAIAPETLTGFLCSAGVVDVRALRAATTKSGLRHDGLAHAIASIACAIAAAQGGAALVHPRFVPALWGCSVVLAALALRHRRDRDARALCAPALMFAAAVLGAPPPAYYATATTLDDAFVGERIAFTGAYERDERGAALVRYAITCCRADATPMAVRLAGSPPAKEGTWLHADGTLELHDGELALRAERLSPVAPPADPYIYR